MNGEIVRLGDKADPDQDDIRTDGRPLPKTATRIYLALNKPKGYASTRGDPHAERTVMDLLEKVPASVYPVGRLDQETQGLLLFTNDGDFAYRLTHPRFKVSKVYEALTQGLIRTGSVRELQRGVELEDGWTLPAEVKVIGSHAGPDGDESLIRLTIREGRKRQVRRMLDAVGHPVLELRRIRIGSLGLGDLPLGEWRYLDVEEVWKLLKEAAED